MKAYKLTDQNNETQNDTEWGPGVSHSATGTNPELCSDGWIHFYQHHLIAVLMNPAHANFQNPKLWECETAGEELHEPLKSGCKTLTTIKREIPLPEVTVTQRIAFWILCVKEVYKEPNWNQWADKWLSGEDRSKESAAAARVAARVAYAANVTYAADAAYYAAYAAYADYAAYATAGAAYATAGAADIGLPINFIKLAEQAMTIK